LAALFWPNSVKGTIASIFIYCMRARPRVAKWWHVTYVLMFASRRVHI
jgi:hypothetical protein